MKYRFLKDKLWVYLGTFTLPVFLLGMLFLSLIYVQERGKVQEKMGNSLELAARHMDSFISDSTAFQIYLGSGQRMGQFFRIFHSDSIDFESGIALKFLSAYMVALKSSRTDIHSVYFYLDNEDGRIITSEDNIETLGSGLADDEWLDPLLTMKGNETRAVVRGMPGSGYEKDVEMFSLFRRFPNYKGGIVINYALEEQKERLRQTAAFEKQYMMVADSAGQLLFSNYELGEEEQKMLSLWLAGQDEKGTVALNGRRWLIERAYEETGAFCVVTMVPYAVVNQILFSNMRIFIFLVPVLTMASAFLAYYRTRRNYEQLDEIIDIFDRAEKKLSLPEEHAGKDSVYGEILNNIIRTFLRNNQLQMQLAERKNRQTAAQLQALQYQINPHFLFNTLQAINYEILAISEGEYGNANRMVEDLSDMLRYSLDSFGQEVTVREEVENCKKYVDIQKMREDRSFAVEWEIDPRVEKQRIRRLLLQPLVENAVSHGLKYRENGRLRIAIRPEGGNVVFKVVDNGKGIAREELRQIRSRLEEGLKEELEIEHIGLQNVNQRLILTYGETAALRVLSRESVGTIQLFRLPFRAEEGENILGQGEREPRPGSLRKEAPEEEG
ncbi:MAG TPA: sensor histidine kinase [Candidatus Eisenbergiella merdavium]|uniref:Sensor histidine kinase n=1 Tax=Candidatus Eisenbergiella merdavium TaxID=2838551 RepID=A0A9D2NI11_9FIRM|nr:sensor histidine kinase [Candidatus Eisenbergiella merdavium]